MTRNYIGKKGSNDVTLSQGPGLSSNDCKYIWLLHFICNAEKEVCCILSKNIALCLIKYPLNRAEVKKANREFLQKFELPMVLGCVDGKHIPISEPHKNAYD